MTAQRTIRNLTAALVLVGGLFAGAPAFGQAPATRVRILLVADTNGRDAKLHAFAQDRANLEEMLKIALREQQLEDRYTLDVLEGDDATPVKVLEHYENLKTEPGEVLFFYYSGHGGTDKNTGHFLAMAAGNLPRSELRTVMEAHRPRLLILLSDCCADYSAPVSLGAVPTKAEKEFKLVRLSQTAQRERDGSLARQILFEQRGVVDINACQTGKGSDSVHYKGGYFTLAMIRLMNATPKQYGVAQNGTVEWPTFFVALQNETLRDVTTARRPNQLPMAFAMNTSVESKK
jgi:hypothetical protein